MGKSKKFLLKSLSALALTILVSVSVAFAWFRLLFPVDSSMVLEVVSSDNVSMELTITNNQGEPGTGLRLYSMVPGEEHYITVRFVNISSNQVTFDLVFKEIFASLFNFEDDFGNPIISDLSLLNVFSISYKDEDQEDGFGQIIRTFYSLSYLYFQTNGVVFNESNAGLDIVLLNDIEIGAYQSIIIGLTLRFMNKVYNSANSMIGVPLNLFQSRSMQIESLSIVEQE